MDDPKKARERLQNSVDTLARRANLYARMQTDPLKVIGGATGVGLLLGLLVGRGSKKTRRIYVDRTLPKREQKLYEKHQKQLANAQKGSPTNRIMTALVSAVTTIAIRALQERVLAPQIERLADQLNERAAHATAPGGATQGGTARETVRVEATTSTRVAE